ncbi:MAG: von Willebrand factor type A domain-containing protein [Acidobacteriota bacterium]|nr:von Willebrand factor type A domain-containing protein [Acidobacteriota bacterium]
MNSKRRAELQRKLSMGAVPRPPSNLAQRIKADIPKYLEAHDAPRERFSWSSAIRIAASLMLLLTTALVTRKVLEPNNKAVHSVARERLEPAVLTYGSGTTATAAAGASATTAANTEFHLDITQEVPRAAEPQMRAATAPEPVGHIAVTDQAAPAAPAVAQNTASAPPPAPAPAVAPPPEPITIAESAPPPDFGAQNASVAMEEVQLPERRASSDLVARAYGDTLPLERPTSVFGISVDPAAFHAVQTAIENGERPNAAAINVDALVNYFAGAPQRAPRRDVALEVEASPAPVAADGDRAILRFSVDTSVVRLAPRSSVPPVARNAHIEIDVNSAAVASVRRIGESPVAAESVLLHNMSVTGLYELQMKPNLKASQRVATITLRYVSVTDGRTQTIRRVIQGRDLARSWNRASRRHRLASLGAVWSEKLRSNEGGMELAKRAEELLTQDPSDTRARELESVTKKLSAGGGM